MISIVYSLNPFDPEAKEFSEMEAGKSIMDWVGARYPEELNFPLPTIALVNGEPWLREKWAKPLPDNAKVEFVSQSGWTVVLWTVAALLVGVVAAVLLTPPTPDAVASTPGTIGDPDPVYSITGQRNQIRLNSVIEDPYGLNRLWPSKAAREYTKFIDNEQEIYLLLCLGQGYYDLGNAVVQIEDTAIASFDDIEFEFYEPGEDVTLFPDNVLTSGEVSNTTLYGTNEAEFADWIGPFAANGSGTDAVKIEVDLVFPSGLYTTDDDGGLSTINVTVSVEYREIDDAGAAVGAGTWSTLSSFTKTLKTNTPQRFTVSTTVSAARYEVRAKRTNTANIGSDAHRYVETVKWVGLRAFLPSTRDYGNVTLLAVKARASNNLNGNSSNRINVIAKRNLPVWNGSAWSTAPFTPSRSVVWAFCNAFRAEYNGDLADAYLPLADLLTLDGELDAAGLYFDHIFDAQLSLWDMATVIARAGLCIPLPVGAQVTLVKDEEQTVPVAIFTKENMVEGSFSISYRLYTEDEFDGVEVEYVDPTTYNKEVVVYPDTTPTNPKQIKAIGVHDRTRAWRIGGREYEMTQRRRAVVSFRTGKEGDIPNFNSLILVNHDILPSGQSGRVMSISGTTVTTNTIFDFSAGGGHSIAFRTAVGDELGPFVVTAGAESNQVELPGSLSAPQAASLPSGDTQEKTVFAFGPTATYTRRCKVSRIAPSSGEEFEVEAIEEDATIYSHDAESPSAAGANSLPGKAPDLPTVTGLDMRDIPARTTLTQAFWNAALGAKYYVVQGSADNVTYNLLGTTTDTYFNFNSVPGTYYIRVAGVNVGQGPWVYDSATVGDTAGIDTSGALINSTGNFTDYRFKRAATIPTTPTGDTPAGWSDAPPAADGNPLWMVKGLKSSAGVLQGVWSTPVQLDGSDGKYLDYVFKRAATIPTTPTGDGLPAGWSGAPPAPDGNPLWVSTGTKTAADVLVGAWSTAVQLDGDSGAAGDSADVEYSIDGSTSWHSTFTGGDIYMRQRIGTGAWSAAIRIVGEAGAAGDSITVEYSIDGSTSWHSTFTGGDIYMRQRVGAGAWSAAIRIVGEAGAAGVSGTFSLQITSQYDGTGYIAITVGGASGTDLGSGVFEWTGLSAGDYHTVLAGADSGTWTLGSPAWAADAQQVDFITAINGRTTDVLLLGNFVMDLN